MTYAPQSSKPRRGGGGIFFFIILAVLGYVIFANRGGPQPNPGGPGVIDGAQVEHDYGINKEIDLTGGGDFEPPQTAKSGSKKMPTAGGSDKSGDWSMDDVDDKNPSSAKNSDWSIEDVDGKKKKDNQFQFSNPKKSKTPTETKSGGDWSIEDAGGKKKPTKTENGDWAIEDADPKKK